MWRNLMIILVALTIGTVLYLTFCMHRFSLIRRTGKKSRVLPWCLSLLLVSLFGLIALVNVITMEIVILHFALFLAIGNLTGTLIRKVTKKNISRDMIQLTALILAALYIGIGVFNAYHVYATRYTVYTDKELPKALRIVEIADAHLGVTLNGRRFEKQVWRIQEENPDVVVITGDFVDDDSSREDMQDACRALGKLDTPYGVYFVFGNHDNGYYRYRNFSSQELREALLENHVVILEDEAVLIDDSFYVIGRRDRSMRGRAQADKLTAPLDRDLFMIMLDHQPNDYTQEAISKADLVLSGHTHGGHIFPAGQIGLLMGANDSRYGMQKREDTVFIVTSGISGWAVPIKTGTFSEYAVIDILNQPGK